MKQEVSGQPNVYIILINWNQLELTLDCIDSLKNVDYYNYKIILIDNNSVIDPSPEIEERYTDVIILRQNTNLGFSAGNNVGIKYALENGADYVLLQNNDTIVDNSFLKVLVERFIDDSTGIGAISPKIYYLKGKNNIIWGMGGKINFWKGTSRSHLQGALDNGRDFEGEFEPDYLTGCSILLPAEVIEKVGFLDENYFAYYEDADYSQRLKKHGYKIVVEPSSKVWHIAGGSGGKSGLRPYILYLNIRNSIWFFLRHAEKINLIITLPILMARYLVYLGYFVLLLKFEKAKNLIRGILDGFKDFSKNPTWT